MRNLTTLYTIDQTAGKKALYENPVFKKWTRLLNKENAMMAKKVRAALRTIINTFGKMGGEKFVCVHCFVNKTHGITHFTVY